MLDRACDKKDSEKEVDSKQLELEQIRREKQIKLVFYGLIFSLASSILSGFWVCYKELPSCPVNYVRGE